MRISNIHEASQTLDELRERKAEIQSAADTLVYEFSVAYSEPPARLVCVKGRGIVWRKRAAIPKDQSIFNFLGATGRSVWEELPPVTCKAFCQFEKRRAVIATKLRILTYQIRLVSECLGTLREISVASRSRQ